MCKMTAENKSSATKAMIKQPSQQIDEIQLVDNECIVPSGGNSLFLCIARSLIYFGYKNEPFLKAIETSCGIKADVLRSDIHLQSLLRVKLCEYWCDNCVISRKNHLSRGLCLREDYANFFRDNLFDFIIQVFQSSINNFSNNLLLNRFAFYALAQILNIRICVINKRQNHNLKNRYYDPTPLNNSNKQLDLLKSYTIYVNEFQQQHDKNNKYVRLLLPKQLWIANFHENQKICTNFAQFNDPAQLESYKRSYFCLKPTRLSGIFRTFRQNDALTFEYKLLFAFLMNVPVQLLVSSSFVPPSLTVNESLKEPPETDSMEFSAEFNTLGKQMAQFSAQSPNKLLEYLNFMWGKNYFNKEMIIRHCKCIE